MTFENFRLQFWLFFELIYSSPWKGLTSQKKGQNSKDFLWLHVSKLHWQIYSVVSMQIEMQFVSVKLSAKPDYLQIILSTKLIILLLNYDSACKNGSINGATGTTKSNSAIMFTDTNFRSIVRRKMMWKLNTIESDWLLWNVCIHKVNHKN